MNNPQNGNSLRDRALRAHIYERDLSDLRRRATHEDTLASRRAIVRDLLRDCLDINPEDMINIDRTALVEVDGLTFGLVSPFNRSDPFLCVVLGACTICREDCIWAPVANMAELGRALSRGVEAYHSCAGPRRLSVYEQRAEFSPAPVYD